MSKFPRVPFEEAVSEPLLFKARFTELSIPQRVIAKAIYGLPLETADERAYWSAFQGAGVYDDIGDLVDVRYEVPYSPLEYEQAVIIVGRRSGKTDAISSLCVAYEALLGGHSEYVGSVQDVICLQIAQDLKTARSNLRLIKAWLESSKVGAKELTTMSGKENITAEQLRLRNRSLITVSPPNIKVRGQAVAICAMDELAVWPKDETASQPDYEVERAVAPAQAQFPFRKRLLTSTPWTKEGLLWKYHEVGTQGKKAGKADFKKLLVINAPTALIQNPRIPPTFLKGEKARDPENFEREYMARFSDSISGFLNPGLLRDAIDIGIGERAPEEPHYYVAAMDPAFRKDNFTFTICHHDKSRGVVQDLLRVWTPQKGQPVEPAPVLDEIAELCKRYRIAAVVSDQYQLETLNQLAMDRGFSIEPQDFNVKTKAKVYGNLQQLLNQRRLKLLDHPAALDELLKLERTMLPSGGVKISAPDRHHDDMATVLAQAAYRSVWMLPTEARDDAAKHVTPPIHLRILQQAEAKRRARTEGEWWD